MQRIGVKVDAELKVRGSGSYGIGEQRDHCCDGRQEQRGRNEDVPGSRQPVCSSGERGQRQDGEDHRDHRYGRDGYPDRPEQDAPAACRVTTQAVKSPYGKSPDDWREPGLQIPVTGASFAVLRGPGSRRVRQGLRLARSHPGASLTAWAR